MGNMPVRLKITHPILAATCAALNHGNMVAGRKHPAPHHEVHKHEQEDKETDDSTESGSTDEQHDEYKINAAIRMKKEIWTSLSTDDRKNFTKLSDKAKATILGIKGFVEEESQECNTHETTQEESCDAEDEPSDAEKNDDAEEDKLLVMINKQKKVPGDLTRLLSSKKKTKKSSLKVSVHEFNKTTAQNTEPTRNELSIVDQGANRGVLGKDATLICKHHQYVTLSTFNEDEHETLQIVTGAAKVLSDKGPIIVTLHNYAYAPNRKTSVHSCIQKHC